MNRLNAGFPSIQQMQDSYRTTENLQTKSLDSRQAGSIFQDILQGHVKENKIDNNIEKNQPDSLKFSKHAMGRLEERGITLSENQLQRLSEGTAKAEAKGINESLVLMDKLAFIVNVPNNTVITAIGQEETDNNIFTNIDGAVII